MESCHHIIYFAISDTHFVRVYSEKDVLDAVYNTAETKTELLEYLGELERWHEWAQFTLRNAWGWVVDRATCYLADDAKSQAAEVYQL